MICKKCQKEYSDELKICPYCQNERTDHNNNSISEKTDETPEEKTIQEEISSISENVNFNESEKITETEKKKKRKHTLLGIVAVIGIIVVVVATVFLINLFSKYSTFNKGQKLLKEGKYDEAISTFESLKNFNGANKNVTEAKYQKALSSLNEPTIDKLKDGIHTLIDLGEYSESKTKLPEMYYTLANLEYNDGNYTDALSHFNLCEGYSNSAEMIVDTRGKKIDEYLSEANYEDAYTTALTDEEKFAVVFENRVAFLSNQVANVLKRPDSFQLSKAYYYSKDGEQRIVLYSGGQNGFGGTTFDYDYCHINADGDWAYLSSVSDLGDEEYSYYDTYDEKLEKMYNNVIRGFISAVMDEHTLLTKAGVERINDLFQEGKLDEITILDVEENKKAEQT